MLAAAGGPDVHPHTFSSPEERVRWHNDMLNLNDDLKKVETFFINVLTNRLIKDEVLEAVLRFIASRGRSIRSVGRCQF